MNTDINSNRNHKLKLKDDTIMNTIGSIDNTTEERFGLFWEGLACVVYYALRIGCWFVDRTIKLYRFCKNTDPIELLVMIWAAVSIIMFLFGIILLCIQQNLN